MAPVAFPSSNPTHSPLMVWASSTWMRAECMCLSFLGLMFEPPAKSKARSWAVEFLLQHHVLPVAHSRVIGQDEFVHCRGPTPSPSRVGPGKSVPRHRLAGPGDPQGDGGLRFRGLVIYLRCHWSARPFITSTTVFPETVREALGPARRSTGFQRANPRSVSLYPLSSFSQAI